MKVLISDYSSEHTTEPLYFNAALNSIGCKSTLWPKNMSAFDIFDITKPDLHITHFNNITKELVIYLEQSNTKIDLIVNITGITQDQLKDMEIALSQYRIIPTMFFVNYYDHGLQSRKTNIQSILHGSDVFLGTEPQQYDIENAIMVNNKNHIQPIGETYHYITNMTDDLSKEVDIALPVGRLPHLYKNYRNIIFKYFDKEIPQLFFDSGYHNASVCFDVNDRSFINTQMKKLFGDENSCNISDINSRNITNKIKQKHTCLHRTKSLLSQLPCKEYTDKIQNLIESTI